MIEDDGFGGFGNLVSQAVQYYEQLVASGKKIGDIMTEHEGNPAMIELAGKNLEYAEAKQDNTQAMARLVHINNRLKQEGPKAFEKFNATIRRLSPDLAEKIIAKFVEMNSAATVPIDSADKKTEPKRPFWKRWMS